MVDASADAPRQRDRPQSLHLQISRILAANYRSLETGSKADLARVLDQFQRNSLFFGTEFPNYPNDISTVCDKMVQHATGEAEKRRGVVPIEVDAVWYHLFH